jgi:hypothetical protein
MKGGFVSQIWDQSGPPDLGGSIGYWTWEIAQRLAQSRSVVVAGSRAAGGKTVERWEGVDFRRFALAPDQWLSMVTRLSRFVNPSHGEFSSRMHYLMYIKRAAKALSAAGCDVIHVRQYSPWVPVIRSANPHAKIVLHMHSDWLVQLEWSLWRRSAWQLDVGGRRAEAIPRGFLRYRLFGDHGILHRSRIGRSLIRRL